MGRPKLFTSCAVVGCNRQPRGKYCMMHYTKLRRHGDPLGGKTYQNYGYSGTPEYRCWRRIIQRCTNPNVKDYAKYGARGIKVAKEWGSFENFYKDMGSMPSPKHTIDRENSAGNYEPGNCRWATVAEQNRNRRTPPGKSGYRGVFWEPRIHKWGARIFYLKKTIDIAFTSDIIEAAYIRDQVAIQLHGHFAILNFQYKEGATKGDNKQRGGEGKSGQVPVPKAQNGVRQAPIKVK